MQDKTIETMNRLLEAHPSLIYALNINSIPVNLNDTEGIDNLLVLDYRPNHNAYYCGAMELLNTVLLANGLSAVRLHAPLNGKHEFVPVSVKMQQISVNEDPFEPIEEIV